MAEFIAKSNSVLLPLVVSLVRDSANHGIILLETQWLRSGLFTMTFLYKQLCSYGLRPVTVLAIMKAINM